ncbi:MAG: DUF3089 domain-containing protein [Microthrixaceae bacterium]
MTTKATAALLTLMVLLTSCSGDSGSDGADADPSATSSAGSESTTASDGGTGSSGDGEPVARYRDYTTRQYSGTDNWLCHPDAEDLCDDDLDSTVVFADGTLEPEPFTPNADAPIDCFYVYPTISQDEGPNSDLDASPQQEGYAARNQVARLGGQCRVFAPVYRQVTLSGLGGNAPPEARETAYGDVLDAWKSYMAQDNDGRGVVLVGHSQGSGMLRRLIAEEIDPNDDVRAKLVSAYLAGSSVAVPEGEVVGGDFDNVPLCEQVDQTGCVLSWASFRSTAPPPENAFFGRAEDEAMRAACVSPADLSGEPAELNGYYPSTRGGTILADSDGAAGEPTKEHTWVDPGFSVVETPYVSVPGLVSGACASNDTTDWLEVTVNGDPADPRADDIGGDLTPEWGLHLVDVSLVMGDMVDLVTAQSEAYLA